MSVSAEMLLWTDELISCGRVLPGDVFICEDEGVTAGKRQDSWITFSTSLKSPCVLFVQVPRKQSSFTNHVEPFRFGKVTQCPQMYTEGCLFHVA